ncbi:MAG: hypothetical protein A3J67_05165 [Parcubacteria group bacterium RIFCSPHIGHO2_02_FULL_48_10b]|nr:MAG: hypothetical protein A3J67_05165 [Parcubacteria group bacterium RIFCSPHIGHO2_02_FULL_48_10b]
MKEVLQLPLEARASPPKRAGVATLGFLRSREFQRSFARLSGFDFIVESPRPFRYGSKIVIPADAPGEFRTLAGGEKFLLKFDGEASVWFGGTDEQPFLAELDLEVYNAFVEGGEKTFLEELKPPIIRFVERAFNVEVKRQGDILAVRLAKDWPELHKRRLINWSGLTEKSSLLGTQHYLKGRIAPVLPHCLQEYLGGDAPVPLTALMICEGVVTTHDHAPLELNGPHLIAQNQHLVNPLFH